MTKDIRKVMGVALGLAVFVAVAATLRGAVGIDFDAESVRTFVLGLGALGPLAFIALTGMRLFIGLPSQIVLMAGGLCFGALFGTIYGALGLTLSGLFFFFMARWSGREAVLNRIPQHVGTLLDRISSRAGPLLIALGTGYPIGPISAYHALAGITPMRGGSFLVALLAGSLVRAGLYTFMGHNLASGSWTDLMVASGLLACVALVPLAFPRGRRWISVVILGHRPPAPEEEPSRAG